jgi:hypothetical protein
LHSVLYEKTKFDRLYTILQKNGGTDTKAMGQTEKKSFRQLCVIFTKNSMVAVPALVHPELLAPFPK